MFSTIVSRFSISFFRKIAVWNYSVQGKINTLLQWKEYSIKNDKVSSLRRKINLVKISRKLMTFLKYPQNQNLTSSKQLVGIPPSRNGFIAFCLQKVLWKQILWFLHNQQMFHEKPKRQKSATAYLILSMLKLIFLWISSIL